MDVTRQIELAHRYMKDFHKSDYSGHDVAHVERVTSLAQTISKCEQQGEYLIITLSALLHDVIDDKLTNKANALDRLKHFKRTFAYLLINNKRLFTSFNI